MATRRSRIFYFEVAIWAIIIVAAITMAVIRDATSTTQPAETPPNGAAPAQDAAKRTASAEQPTERERAEATVASFDVNSSERPPAEPEGYWTGPINGTVPATLRGATVLSTDELTALIKRERVVLIDASNAQRRPEKLAPNAPWMPTPHAIIPDSVWIAGSGLGEITPDVDATFRAQLGKATGNNLDTPVVVYCHERCWLSYNAAKRALSYGYRNVYWYPDGIEGWRAAGLPTSVAVAIER